MTLSNSSVGNADDLWRVRPSGVVDSGRVEAGSAGDPFVECRMRLGDAVQRLGATGSSELIRSRAPSEFAGACGFTRAMLSAVRGSRWVPLQLHTRDELDPRAAAFRAYVDSDAEIPLANMLAETEMVRRRTAVLVDELSIGRRAFRPIIEVAGSPAYVAAPLVVEGRVIGFVHADRVGQSRDVDVDDLRYVEAFAGELSVVYQAATWTESITEVGRRASSELRRAVDALELIAAGSSDLSGAPDAMPGASADTESVDRARTTVASLSPREWEVLHHVADGATNRVIAQRLSLSEDTVKTHMRGVLRKLQVRTRGAAVARYVETGGGPRGGG